MKHWIIEFIKKHWGKGLHRWAFWLEGIVIGLLVYHFFIV
jgi:hypothetical protein